ARRGSRGIRHGLHSRRLLPPPELDHLGQLRAPVDQEPRVEGDQRVVDLVVLGQDPNVHVPPNPLGDRFHADAAGAGAVQLHRAPLEFEIDVRVRGVELCEPPLDARLRPDEPVRIRRRPEVRLHGPPPAPGARTAQAAARLGVGDEVGGVRHATPPRSRTPCASRCAAISQYRSSISMPMARSPNSFAATSVEPLPMYGSRTDRTPGAHPMHHCMSATGFWLTWTRPSACSRPPRCAPLHRRENRRAVVRKSVHASSQSLWSLGGVPSRLSHTSQPRDAGSLSAKWFPPQRIVRGATPSRWAGSNGSSSPTIDTPS